MVQNEIDPAPIFEAEELEMFVKKAGRRLPTRYGITPEVWKDKVIEVNWSLDSLLIVSFVNAWLLPIFCRINKFHSDWDGLQFWL